MIAALRGRWLGDWSVSLRGYVTAAMLVALLPLLAHAVLVTWHSYSTSRHWAERDLLHDAEHLAEDIDVRLDVALSVMQLVSVSPAARRGDAEAVRQLLDSARMAGLIRAAVVTDPEGAVVVSAGMGAGQASGITGAAGSPQFLVGRLEGEAVLTAAWPVVSADPRLARLEFAVPAEVLHGAKAQEGGAAWHVTVVTDRQGAAAWAGSSALAAALLRTPVDPAATAGVVPAWSAPDGSVHSVGFAQAGRSGLRVLVAQPSPGLYERVPFGPLGAAAIAAGLGLLSVVLARLGAVQIHAAYRSAMGGAQGGRVRIRDAVRLGAEMRSTRDRLFQAVGGIGVVELTRPPGGGWLEAEVAASDSIRTLLGLAPEEALSAERLLGALAREDRSALGTALADVERGQAGVFTRLVRSERAGRPARYLNVVGMLREPVPGAAAQLVLTVQDVTGQKEAERELQAQASRLRLATEIAGLGVWEGDAVRGSGHASERMWEIIGLEPHGTLDRETFLAVVHPDDRARVAEAVGTPVPGMAATVLRYRLVRPDGGMRHVRSSRWFVDDDSGGVHMVGVLFDETETVMAQRALAASETRFRLAVEVAELGVFERRIDSRRNEGVWNERMWRIRGLEPQPEPMGHDEMVAMIHPDDRARVVAAMQERRETEDGTSDYEFRLIRADGEERTILSRSVKTHHPEDGAVYIVAINQDVTERRTTERALAEGAARLRLAVETAGLGFAQLELGTGKGIWSERLFEIYGLEPGERPTVEALLSLVHPQDRAAVTDAMARQRAGDDGEVAEAEFRIVRPDGQERVVHVRSVKLRRADGTETLSTVTQDVTDRKLAERRLAESEARLRLAVETAELGVAQLDPATGEGVWNAQQYRICGLEPAAGRPGMEETLALVHPDDRAMFAREAQALAEGADGHESRFDVRILRPDGAERILHVHSITRRPPGRGVTLLSVTQDVTEQRRAQHALAESEARFRLAVETAGLGMAVYDSATGRALWSERLFQICGLDPRDGRPPDEGIRALAHPADRHILERGMRAHRTGEHGFTSENELRMVQPGGAERTLLLRAVTLRRPDGAVTVLTVVQDITDQRMAARRVAESEARFRLAVETAGLGVSDRNLATGEASWSGQFHRIMGVDPQAARLGNEETLAMVHPEDRDLIEAVRARHADAEDGFASEYDYRMLRPDGEARILHARSVTLRRADGTVRLLSVNQDVTEQRAAEQALAASELRLRLTAEATGVGIWDHDPATGITFWSEQMFRLRGLEGEGRAPPREFITEHTLEEDRPVLLGAWDRLRAGEPALGFEYRAVWPDGTVRWLHSEGRGIRDAEGRVVRMLGLVTDVTDRREAELALLDRSTTLELALEAADLGIWTREPGNPTRQASARVWAMLGHPGREGAMTREELLACLHPEDREAVLREWVPEDGQPTPRQREFRAVWPDGSVHHFQSRRAVMRDAAGRTLRVIGVIADVTEARRAAAALAASEARLRLAVEAAELGIFDYDPDTREGYWSERTWRMRGLEPREGIPTVAEVLAAVHPDDREASTIKNRQQFGATEGTRLDDEFRVMWPDGTVRHLLLRAVLHRGADGRSRVFGINMDVTERRTAALALEASEARLRLAVETAELGFFEHDPTTRTSYWSERIWRMRGLEPQAAAPGFDESYPLVHPDDRDRLRAHVRGLEALPLGEIGTIEYRVVRPDGTIRHIVSRTMVRRHANGRDVMFHGINLDVTESRLAAEALAASEERLRVAVDAADMGIFEFDPASRAGYWSERIWRMRGLEPRPGTLSFDEVMAIVHPDDREATAAQMRQNFDSADGARNEFGFRIVRPDGEVRHIQSRSVTQRRADGGGLRIFGVNIDVTEQRRAALALEASEERLRLAVEAAEMGVFEYDPGTGSSYWSERVWRMRGLEPRPGAPAFKEAMALVHPGDREAVGALLRRQISRPEDARTEYEFRVVRPDGAVRHLHVRTMMQHRPDGGPGRIFGINLDITERRLAAQALEESEARLRLAGEAAGLGVFQVNMPEGTGYWSERMWRIRGLEPQPGLPGSEVAVATVHPDDRALVSGMRKAAATWPHGQVMRQQFRVVWPDGQLRHVASHAIVLRGRDEGSFSLIGVNADITEQVEREQALREAAARFELAIDAAGLAVWDWTPDTDRMTWSPRIWEIMGLAPQEEVPFLAIRQRVVHPEDRDRVPMAWIRAVSGGEERRGQGDFRVVRKDGSMRYLHWQGIPLRDGEGRIVRFAGVLADVTEARLSELALRTSEELFRMAAEAAEQGVWDHDLASGALRWSPLLWRIHGLAPAEGGPEMEARFAAIHPEDRAEVMGLSQELAAAPANEVLRRSYRIVRPDGAVRTLEQQAMQVAGADGRPARIVGVVRDVTEARELAAQTMVADKLATLGEMAGAIAHELSQPLQAVMATAATARMRLVQGHDEATVERVRDRLAWIERQTSRAGKTIQHLLAFSRGESSDGITLLPAALEGAMELAGYGLRHAAIEVSVQLPDDLPPVRGGQVEIEQVLVNLLNNARDAMAERPVRRIRIEGRRDGDLVRLDVADTGGGVPADKLERIFEPFYTTKPVGRGTGIGLSVARRTMRALDGAITVVNIDDGACFTLAFRSALPQG